MFKQKLIHHRLDSEGNFFLPTTASTHWVHCTSVMYNGAFSLDLMLNSVSILTNLSKSGCNWHKSHL